MKCCVMSCQLAPFADGSKAWKGDLSLVKCQATVAMTE